MPRITGVFYMKDRRDLCRILNQLGGQLSTAPSKFHSIIQDFGLSLTPYLSSTDNDVLTMAFCLQTLLNDITYNLADDVLVQLGKELKERLEHDFQVMGSILQYFNPPVDEAGEDKWIQACWAVLSGLTVKYTTLLWHIDHETT